MNDMKKRILFAILASAILICLDQFVKYIINSTFKVGESLPLIDKVFQLTYIQNQGAAWGSFSGKIPFLLIITIAILICAVYVYIQLARRQDNKYSALRIGLIFLISGAIGNMIDRGFRGFVVDMFDFCLINFPVFNVADIYVTCSFIFIAILIMFKYKDDELSDIIHNNANKTSEKEE